jgi:hypothetical protein
VLSLSWLGKLLFTLALTTTVTFIANIADMEKDNSVKCLVSGTAFKSHVRACVNFDLYASDNIWAGRNGAPYGGKLAEPPAPVSILPCVVCQLSPRRRAGGYASDEPVIY